MNLLLASLGVLLFGPVLHRVLRGHEAALSLVDGFVFISMGGLIFMGVLPESYAQGGGWVFVLCFFGFLGPTFVERNFHRLGTGTHSLALVLGMLGLVLHSFGDGIALTELCGLDASHAPGAHAEDDHTGVAGMHAHLPLAVLLHRIPVGLTIWWLLYPRHGWKLPSAVLAIVGLSTIGGYASGPAIVSGLSLQGIALFQAFVAGSLLHVVIHRPHRRASHASDAPPCCQGKAETLEMRGRWLEGLGGLLGIGLVGSVLIVDAHQPDAELSHRAFETFLALALQSAPPLLIAYILAGLMHAFMPRSSVHWMRRGPPWGQSLKGMAVGLPLPICSCGVVPLYRTLIQQGAPATSALAFLVATPELGLDAVLLSLPLLGGPMTLARVVAAGILAFVVGWFVGWLAKRGEPVAGQPAQLTSLLGEGPISQRLWAGLRASFGENLNQTAPWVLLGLTVAALIAPLLEQFDLARPAGTADVLIFAALGVPTYVCASGATPLVAVLLIHGVSPGAGLAFLLTGPATNVTTFGVLTSLHGRRIAVIFSVSMLALAVGLGYATNLFLPSMEVVGKELLHGEHATFIHWSALAVVGLAFLIAFTRRGPRDFLGTYWLEARSTKETSSTHGCH